MNNSIKYMIETFDHSYDMSDDHSVWKSGEFKKGLIREYYLTATGKQKKAIEKLWNQIVKNKWREDVVNMYQFRRFFNIAR